MTSSLRTSLPKKASTISCSLMGIENLKISTMLSISLLLTNLPSLVTGFHSATSCLRSGRLPPFLSPPLPNPLFSASGFGASGFGACSAITFQLILFDQKNKKNNIQVQMAVKNLAFNIFSAISAVAVVLINWISCCTVKMLSPVRGKSILAKNMIQRWTRTSESGKREIIEYIQMIVNLFIGIAFSESLVIYHSFLVETIVTISYQLHLLSLNWVVDLPDYSAYLKESESIKMITTLFYLIFGYIGLSTQISFTLDLISLFSYPFRALRRFCDRAYKKLNELKGIMVDILTIKKKYWVTCPYPQYMLKDTFKIVYICSLPLIIYLMVLVKSYYLFMSILILVFKTIINIGINISIFFQQFGRMICTFIGLDIQNDSLCFNDKTLNQKIQSISNKLRCIEWIPVFKWKKIKDIFMDAQMEPINFEQKYNCYFVSIISVYETFNNFFK